MSAACCPPQLVGTDFSLPLWGPFPLPCALSCLTSAALQKACLSPLRKEHLSTVFFHVQDRRNCLAKALDEMKTAFPRDMENEKAMLIMTLLLARNVANHAPSLLHDVFRTTVTFINQNLFTYVRNLLRNVRISDTSPWLLMESRGPSLLAHPLLSTVGNPAEPEPLLKSLSPPPPPPPPPSPYPNCRLTIGLREAKAGSHYWWDTSSVGRHGVRGKMAKGSSSLGLLFIVTNLSLSMYVVCA